jgi:hypothetical protein
MEAIDVSPTNSEPITSKDKPITMEYEDNFEASQYYDEEKDVAVQQHQLAIAPSSEVDENVMVQVKQTFYNEFRPIYLIAREGCSQMLDRNVYSRYVNIVKTYPILPKDDRDPYRKNIYNKIEIGHGVEGDNLHHNGEKVAVYECFFDIIKLAHVQLEHARDPGKVYNHIKEVWYGVTEKACQLYISICPECLPMTRINTKAKMNPLSMIFSDTIGQRTFQLPCKWKMIS